MYLSTGEFTPERSEPRADLLREKLRLLPGREVPAFIELVVVDEFGIRPLRPAPRSWIQLFNNGASLYQVQHALGHKDQRMSARYAHLLPENRE